MKINDLNAVVLHHIRIRAVTSSLTGLDIRQTNFKDINHKPGSSYIKVKEKNVKMLH